MTVLVTVHLGSLQHTEELKTKTLLLSFKFIILSAV